MQWRWFRYLLFLVHFYQILEFSLNMNNKSLLDYFTTKFLFQIFNFQKFIRYLFNQLDV